MVQDSQNGCRDSTHQLSCKAEAEPGGPGVDGGCNQDVAPGWKRE